MLLYLIKQIFLQIFLKSKKVIIRVTFCSGNEGSISVTFTAKVEKSVMPELISFHLDENVNNAIADGLRRRSIDVTTSVKANLISATDNQ